MQMLLSYRRHITTMSCALLLALTATLSGCASNSAQTDEAKAASASASATAETKTDKLDKPESTMMERWFGFLRPYKIDVQQGNFVSSEDLALLKEGMTQQQVRFILGTPLLTDMFHDWRWDYVFRLQRPGEEVLTNRVTVFFENGRVARIASTDLPKEEDYIANIVKK